jgi:hypothetical protein
MRKNTSDVRNISRTASIVAVVATLVLMALLGVSFLINKSKRISLEETHYSWACLQATKTGKSYYFSDIAMHISIFDTTFSGQKYRMVKMRTQYHLNTLKDIESTENVFLESYSSSDARVIPWKGSDLEEAESGSPNRFWVKFSAKKDQEKVITTGADYVYSYPLKKRPENFFINGQQLDSNRKVYYYPNNEDYIDHFQIKVDSLAPEITLPESSMFRQGNGLCIIGNAGTLYKEKTTDTFKVQINSRLPEKPPVRICEWQSLGPADVVGILFNW